MSKYPEISFVEDTDEGDLEMANDKGLFSFDVKISDDRTVRVYFFKLDHFAQAVEHADTLGSFHFHPDAIVLTELSKERMYRAIEYLFHSGYLNESNFGESAVNRPHVLK